MSDAGKAVDAGKGSDAGKGVDAGKTVDAGKIDAGKTGDGKQPVKASTTILDDNSDALRDAAAGGEGGDKKVAATWPDDWRDQIAGTDDKMKSLLKRYASPNAVASALQSLRTRVDAGEFKKPLAKDATDDEIAQYRKDNGIPDKADGYAMPDGIKIGEEDKPIIDNFLTFAHTSNMTPQEVQRTIAWYYQAQDEANAQKFENDKAFRTEQEDSLRAEWGPEFRGNMNGLKAFMTQAFGAEMMTNIMGGRLADGTAAGNNAAFLKAMVALYKEVNPQATLTGPGSGDNAKAMEDRIAEIEKMQSTNRDAYFKDERIQTEYRGLLAAREKLEARKKG